MADDENATDQDPNGTDAEYPAPSSEAIDSASATTQHVPSVPVVSVPLDARAATSKRAVLIGAGVAAALLIVIVAVVASSGDDHKDSTTASPGADSTLTTTGDSDAVSPTDTEVTTNTDGSGQGVTTTITGGAPDSTSPQSGSGPSPATFVGQMENPTGSFVSDLVFSPDSSRIIAVLTPRSGGPGRTTGVWDAASGALLYSLPDTGYSYSPDGRLLVNRSNSGATLIDAADGSTIATLPPGHFPSAFSSDSARLMTSIWPRSDAPATVTVWDISSMSSVFTVAVAGPVQGQFSPDGTMVLLISGLASPSSLGSGLLYDLDSGTLRGTFSPVYDAAFSPDSSLVVTIGSEQRARVWSTATGTSQRVLELPFTPERSTIYGKNLAISPDNTKVLLDGSSTFLHVWDIGTGLEAFKLPAQSPLKFFFSDDKSVEFHRDGASVWTMYDVWSGKSIRSLDSSTVPVAANDNAHRLSADHSVTRLLMTTATDSLGDKGATILWDAQTGAVLAVFNQVAWQVSPDGTTLLIGDTLYAVP